MFQRLAHLLSLLLFASLAGGEPASAAPDGLQLDPHLALNAYEALVEQEFDCARNGLRTLAATDDVRSDDWEQIKGPLSQFAKGVPVAAAVWFARPDGSYFLADIGPTDQNIGDRHYFPALMAGKEVWGDLVISKSTGARSTIVAVPIRKGGRVVGALGISIAMERLAAELEAQIGFPESVMFYALDSEGQIALHRQSSLLFEFAGQLEGPSLKAAIEEMLSKPEGLVRYQFRGAERQAIFKRSSASGWTFALRW